MFTNVSLYFQVYANSNTGKSVLNKAFVEKNEHYFFDCWIKAADWVRDVQVIDSMDGLDDPMDLLVKLQSLFNDIFFQYNGLTRFSVSTGLGIPAVFQYRIPALYIRKLNVHTTREGSLTQVKVQLSYDCSQHGFRDASIYNPIAKLTHSVRKSVLTEFPLSLSASTVYDSSNQTLKFAFPLISKTHDSNGDKDAFTASSVLIAKDNDETQTTLCPECGYKFIRSDPSKRLFNEHAVEDKDNISLRQISAIYSCEVNKAFLDKA